MKPIPSSKPDLQVGELQDYVTKPDAGDWRRRKNPFRLATLCHRDCRCVLLSFGPPHSSLYLCDQISVILSTSYRSRLIARWPLHCYHYQTVSQNSRVLSPPETWFAETEYGIFAAPAGRSLHTPLPLPPNMTAPRTSTVVALVVLLVQVTQSFVFAHILPYGCLFSITY